MSQKKYEVTAVNNGPRFGVRHLQTLLLFLGMAIAFSMRVNMSVAVVPMSKEFHWDTDIASRLHSAFFWGYVVLQIPGGELARIGGGKRLISIAIGVNAAVSLITPMFVNWYGWGAAATCRVLQGFTQAFVYPTMHHLISQWVPKEEKGRLGTIIYAGAQLGLGLELICSGFIESAWGWAGIFYSSGILAAAWTLLYLALGSDSPEASSRITQEELRYIQNSLDRTGKEKIRKTAPWFKIMTSLPFWAVIVAHCGQNWGFFTLMTQLPTYMDAVLHFNIKTNGVISSLPYWAMYLMSLPLGAMTDLIIRKKWLGVTNTRKLFNTIGLCGPALSMVALQFVPADNTTLTVAMLVLGVGVNAAIYTGFMLVHIDLAPNFSSSLMGVTNFLANIVSIIAPLVCGAITTEKENPDQWRIVFLLAAAIYFLSNLFFLMFSTSEKQPWNDAEVEDDVEMKATTKSEDETLSCDTVSCGAADK